MTIDERLEALTRNLELLSHETEKHDCQIGALVEQSAGQDSRLERTGERLDALTQSLQLLSLETDKHDRQFDRAAKLITEVAEGTARLLRVVEMHEHRIDSHDDRLDKLE
jgi:ABC-type transporter Mla subunit MlaD